MAEIDDDHEKLAMAHLIKDPVAPEAVGQHAFKLAVKRLAFARRISRDDFERAEETAIKPLIGSSDKLELFLSLPSELELMHLGFGGAGRPKRWSSRLVLLSEICECA